MILEERFGIVGLVRKVHVSHRTLDHGLQEFLALRDYEGRVRLYTDQLISQLNEHSGKAINACQWFNFYSFDIMGDMAFGTRFDMVKSGKPVCLHTPARTIK